MCRRIRVRTYGGLRGQTAAIKRWLSSYSLEPRLQVAPLAQVCSTAAAAVYLCLLRYTYLQSFPHNPDLGNGKIS